MDQLARPPALGTLGGGGEGEAARPPLNPNHAGPPAVRAGLGGGARLAAGAMAGIAHLSPCQLQLLLTAEGGLLKRDRKISPQALSLLRGISSLLLATKATEAATEEGAKDISQVDVPHIEAAEAAATPKIGVYSRMAELVILRPLLLVGQDLIRLIDLFEFGLLPLCSPGSCRGGTAWPAYGTLFSILRPRPLWTRPRPRNNLVSVLA